MEKPLLNFIFSLEINQNLKYVQMERERGSGYKNQKVSLCIISLTGLLLVAGGASFGYPTGIKAIGRICLGALITRLTSSSLNAPTQHEPKPSE
jgi:hypothetical protein